MDNNFSGFFLPNDQVRKRAMEAGAPGGKLCGGRFDARCHRAALEQD